MRRRLSDFFNAPLLKQAHCVLTPGTNIKTFGAIDICGLDYDSRNIHPGFIYFALPGLHTDGHRYIADAAGRGAAVIVYQNEGANMPKGPVYVKAEDSRLAMAPISAAFYENPSDSLVTIGVTGTEGKSTTVFLIWQLLGLAGERAGFFSTVQHSVGGEAEDNTEHQTTPEATAVQRLLAGMRDSGCRYAVIEASSHGLSKKTGRLDCVGFDAAVVTNVTHEHLEFHGTWEQYRDDKANLFRALDERMTGAGRTVGRMSAPEPFGVINADDPSADYFRRATKRKTITFSAHGLNADLVLHTIESSSGGNWYTVTGRGDEEEIDIRDRLPGAFNAGNVMAALIVVSRLLNMSIRELAPLAAELKPVRGRMTSVDRGQNFEVLVDYAHTPSSFNTIFPPLRHRQTGSHCRLITLFGSAGERDTQKRSEQGKIAAEYSDIVVLCDEDPRGEVPMDILEEIATGCDGVAGPSGGGFTRGENLFLIPDRPQAIRKAFSLARPGDIVLLLGKGHENSIIYKDHTMPYDEIAEAGRALEDFRIA